MADLNNFDDTRLIVNGAADAIVALVNTIETLLARELFRLGWQWRVASDYCARVIETTSPSPIPTVVTWQLLT